MSGYILDGTIHALVDGEELPEGAVPITGQPVWDDEGNPISGVIVDPETGVATLDTALQADMEADPAEVRRMHALKATEAALVASGATLTAGILHEEAAALGTSIEDLAASVLAAGAADREREVARRLLKTGGE